MKTIEKIKRKKESLNKHKLSCFSLEKIKRKKEFSGLPDSIVMRVSEIMGGDIKNSRALLRKYFGVFLTNRVLKGKGSPKEILKIHISSKKRNYEEFYKRIFDGAEDVGSVIDLGCGVNGFSYGYLKDVLGDVNYVGVEAVGQLVEQSNMYFNSSDFFAKIFVGDLFDVNNVLKILKKSKKNRVVFMFQIIDALENLKRDFSKEFISKISSECEAIVLSLPMESLGGRKKFAVRRKWLMDFLNENFVIKKDFTADGERIIYFIK